MVLGSGLSRDAACGCPCAGLSSAMNAAPATRCMCGGVQQLAEPSWGPLPITAPCRAAGRTPAPLACWQLPFPALLPSLLGQAPCPGTAGGGRQPRGRCETCLSQQPGKDPSCPLMCQNQCISHSPEWGIHRLEGKLPRLPTGAAGLPAGTRGENKWVHGEAAEPLGTVPSLPPPCSRLRCLCLCWGAAQADRQCPMPSMICTALACWVLPFP